MCYGSTTVLLSVIGRKVLSGGSGGSHNGLSRFPLSLLKCQLEKCTTLRPWTLERTGVPFVLVGPFLADGRRVGQPLEEDPFCFTPYYGVCPAPGGTTTKMCAQ